MIKENEKEYEMISSDMTQIKNRITIFLGFLIGGSGIAYGYIVALPKNIPLISLALMYLFTALMITAFLYIALYKFNSYNRLAGYRKLLNQEKLKGEINITHNKKDNMNNYSYPNNFIGWELCMSLYSNYQKTYNFATYWPSTLVYRGITIETIKEKFHELNGYKPKIDRKATRRGIKLVFQAMTRNNKTQSWKYPLYTSYIYFVLIFFYSYLAMVKMYEHFSTPKDISSVNWKMYLPDYVLYLFMTLVIAFVIKRAFSDIFKLMKGSKTVSAYCWKFLKYRIMILNGSNIKPYYWLTENPEPVYPKLTNDSEIVLYIDPGTAKPDQIAELLSEFSTFYRMLGGGGITFKPEEIRIPHHAYYE